MKENHRFLIANPVWILFFIYLFANINSLVFALSGLPLDVDSQQYDFGFNDIIQSSIALFFSFFFFLFIYKIALHASKVREIASLGNVSAIAILVIQISYLMYSYIYGVNIAGVEDAVEGSVFFRLAFSILQPEILYLIAAPGMRSHRYFWLNSVVYLISSLIRGWMGAPFLLLIIVLIRTYPFKITWKKVLHLVFLLIFGALILPFLVAVKWSIRSGGGIAQALSFLSDFGYFNYMFENFGYVINRFQMFGHIALLSQNSNELLNAYESGAFIPYWMDGAPQWVLLKFSGIEIFQLNRYMVNAFFGSDNLAYSTNPGVAGWIFVLRENSLLFFIYLFIITFPPLVFVLRFAGHKYFLLLSCFMFIYLFHGWLGAYFNAMFYLVLFVASKKCCFNKTLKL